MSIRKYSVEVNGNSWMRGPEFEARGIREAREKIESYGSTADNGYVRDVNGRLVAWFCRDRSTNRWFRASIWSR